MAALLESDQAAIWMSANLDMTRLLASLGLQANRRKGRFADACAQIWLWRATAMGLHTYAAHLDSRHKPEAPGAKDWDGALKAIDVLRTLQDYKDVRLWQAIKTFDGKTGAATYRWLDDLSEAIKKAATSGTRPYRDDELLSRLSVKQFCHWCWMFYGDIPPALAVHFADLINYKSARLTRQYLREWRIAFDTDSIV